MHEADITALEQEAGLDNLVARLLAGRGIAPDDAAGFLDPKIRDFLPNPSILQDMDKAAGLILDAIERSDKVTVFADYDVDGGTSAAQIIRWARHFGVEFDLYVPDRVAEGYGPSIDAFKTLKAAGNDLVITVDCGAAAHTALEAAQDLDLPIIVIDHHMMHGEMPPAAALVNPNREDDISGLGHLAAAGVSFLLLVALNRESRKRELKDGPNLMEFLGLSALGTICDVVPLTGLNRAYVRQGLKILSRNMQPGIQALSDVAGAEPPFTTYHAGFVLGPRINAGGRIGRADMGAELLCTENAQTAYHHAAELDRVNTDRKALQDEMLIDALEQARRLPEDKPVICVSMKGWHPGVIGIIAGRLKDQFERPAIVIGINEDGVGKGSGRSIKGVNLGGAITAAKEAGLLQSGGGHAMAGGLSLDENKLVALNEFLDQHLEHEVIAARQNQGLDIDALIVPQAVSAALLDVIESVGPFGAGNPQALFAFADMRVSYAQRLRGGHVRCTFEDMSGVQVSGICFRADASGLADILLDPTTPRVHVAGRLKANNWEGRMRIDLHVVDMALAL